MIVRRSLDWRIILRLTGPWLLLVLANATLWTSIYVRYGPFETDPPVIMLTVLGTALSILLGFRTNSAYARWWEARTLWGAIVNSSRTWARQVMSYVPEDLSAEREPDDRLRLARDLVYRQIAWCYALKQHLRRQPVLDSISPFLCTQELDDMNGQQHIPNALLQRQNIMLSQAYRKGWIDGWQLTQMDHTLRQLTDAMGGCERIKNTVFPQQYSYFTRLFVDIFALLLPFGMAAYLHWLTIPAVAVVAFLLKVLQQVGEAIENPFENTINDIPMDSISRSIETNLKQQLHDGNLPEPVVAVRGFLY